MRKPRTAFSTYLANYIDRCATALKEAGFDVLVEIDNITPPTTTFAQLEQERYDRADDRTDRFDGYAGNASAKGSAMVEQVDAERKRIPLGQPHLIGHHSYNRTVRAEEKRNAKEQRGLEHIRRGRRWAGRADAAAGFQTGREALGTTLRRIERLEAEIRALTRYLAGMFHQWEITVTTDWTGDYGKTLDERLAARPQGAHVVSRDEDRNLARVFIPVSPTARAVTEAQIILLGEEVDHWKAHAAAVQEKEGKKVWSSADFSRGDFVQVGKRWYEIVRVNSKTLTVANGVNSHLLNVITLANVRNATGGGGWTDRLPYPEARGQMSAAQARSRFPEAFTEIAPAQGETGSTRRDGDTP